MKRVTMLIVFLVLTGCTGPGPTGGFLSLNTPGFHANVNNFSSYRPYSGGDSWEARDFHYRNKQPAYIERPPQGTFQNAGVPGGVMFNPDYAVVDPNGSVARLDPRPGVIFPPKGTVCDPNKEVRDRNGGIIKAYPCTLPNGVLILDFKSYREQKQRKGSQNTKR